MLQPSYETSPQVVQMRLPHVVSREEWLSARRRLLAREEEFARSRDALASAHRRLPMVRVEKQYGLEGPGGKARLTELFQDCRQLIVQHFMFGPSWDAGCPTCSAASDELSAGLLA